LHHSQEEKTISTAIGKYSNIVTAYH